MTTILTDYELPLKIFIHILPPQLDINLGSYQSSFEVYQRSGEKGPEMDNLILIGNVVWNWQWFTQVSWIVPGVVSTACDFI